MKKPLQNLLADIMSGKISHKGADIETFEKMKKVFGYILNTPKLDIETKFLLRRIALLLPFGGNALLINTIRQEAINLEDQSGGLLGGVRKKIHNSPGNEDVKIIEAYIQFLDNGESKQFEEITRKYDPYLNFEEITYSLLLLRKQTSKTAKSLLGNLKKLWQMEPGSLNEKAAELHREYDKITLNTKLKRIYDDALKRMDRIDRSLQKERMSEAASFLGDLRFDIRTLYENTSGNVRLEFYFFELYLESLEQQIHPEVLKTITLEQWHDVEKLCSLIIQKALSLAATYNYDVALGEAIHLLEEFLRDKNISDLSGTLYGRSGSLDYFNHAINYLNEKAINQFRSIFKEKFSVDRKELEELVSPFYRTGPIFQLDQLVEVLRTNVDKIKKIIKETPRPVKTHLREHLSGE